MKLRHMIAALMICWGCTAFSAGNPAQTVKTIEKQQASGAPTEIKNPVKNLSISSGNIIVVSKPEDVDKLIKAIQGTTPEKKKETRQVEDKNNIWENMLDEVKHFWDKLIGKKIITLTNLYFLIGGLFVTVLAVHLVKWFIDHIIIKRLTAKTESDLDDKIIEAINPPMTLAIYSLGIYLSVLKILLHVEKEIFDWCGRISLALIAAALVWAIYRLIEILIERLMKYVTKTESKLDDLIIVLLRKSLRLALVVVAILVIGENILGLNITALLAGAGILGLAIAFAAQDTIANFFGSIMIVFDKPFYVGERIKVGDISGVVKSVGFRSTKLETLDGHYITLPNKKITESAIENIAKRPYIKFTINLTLVYETTPEKMQEAMDIVADILKDHEGLNEEFMPKIFFNGFNDWSLNMLVVVWYHPGDWAAANTWMTGINLEILRRFNEADIGFAFPSNTTYLVNGNKNIKISMEKAVD